MPDRKTILTGAGSLIGQAAAHGVLYGELHRERQLYENEAERRLSEVGRISAAEWQLVQNAASKKGRRQINEAFAKGKPTAMPDVGAARRQLPAEIETLIRDLRPLH